MTGAGFYFRYPDSKRRKGFRYNHLEDEKPNLSSTKSGKYTVSWYIGQGDMDLYLDITDNDTGEVRTVKASEIEKLPSDLRASALSLLKLMARVDMALVPWLIYHGYDHLIDQVGLYEA